MLLDMRSQCTQFLKTQATYIAGKSLIRHMHELVLLATLFSGKACATLFTKESPNIQMDSFNMSTKIKLLRVALGASTVRTVVDCSSFGSLDNIWIKFHYFYNSFKIRYNNQEKSFSTEKMVLGI